MIVFFINDMLKYRYIIYKIQIFFIFFYFFLFFFMIVFDYICLQQFIIELCVMFHNLKKKYVRLKIEKNHAKNVKEIVAILDSSWKTSWLQFCGS